jgi:flagellin-specific chaperone FliS
MMDSQENVLNNEAQLEETNQQPVAEEVVKQEENVVTPEPAAEEPVVEEPAAVVEEPAAEEPQEEEPAAEEEATEETASKKVYATKKEVIERIKELAHGDESPTKEEVDLLKTTFYKLHFAEREAAQKAYLEAGGDPEKYTILPDEDEEVFKAEMGVVKEKRAKMFLEQEAEKQENLQKKLDIIEKIKGMVTSPEEANKNYQEFKKLQQEWKEIRLVPAEKANELWRNYQLYVEQFYDLLKLNSEAREYDFKKNLEIKNRLCEAAEKLADEPDVISAFHQLQKLHQEYRETGPVAKDLREEIWTRFKAASTVINKKHQQHFDNLRSKEEENLARKTELCEKVEAIAKEENKGAGDWERHTKQIIDLQAEWKTIGFAPQKMNVKIFERFRAACDDFFGRKAEFFKDMKAKFAENADKKRALIEQAKALQDSTEWKSTSDKLIALQKEWKTIGMVPKRLGDQLWNEFLGACNKFFEARNAANQGTRTAERDNLQKKRDIIAQLKALAEEAGENLQENVQQLVDEYQGIGHVPFKEKDKIFKEYHEVLDKLYKDLNISTARRRLDNFKSNIKNMAERGGDVLDNERARLMRRYEGLKQEIQTYENNLGFLNASSKKGNSLIDEMNRKVQKLKDDCELVRQKIKAIDAENTEES